MSTIEETEVERIFVVTGNLCCIPRCLVSRDLFFEIKEELTDEYKDFRGRVITTTHYNVNDGWLWMPRCYGYNKFKAELRADQIIACYRDADRNISFGGEPILDDHFDDANYELTELQQDFGRQMIQQHFNKKDLRRHGGGCIAVLPCGIGKTYIGIAFLRWTKRRTLFITNIDISVKKISRLIRECLPNLTVMTFDDVNDDLEEILDCDVFVATVHCFVLTHSRFRRNREIACRFARQIGTVIYDEIQTLGGRIFSTIFDLFAPKYQLGLTATYRRRDRADSLYTHTVGPPFILSNIEPPRFPTTVHAIQYFNLTEGKHRQWVYGKKRNLKIFSTIAKLTSDPLRKELLHLILTKSLIRGEDTLADDHPMTCGVGESILIFCNLTNEVRNIKHFIDELIATDDAFGNITVATMTGQSSPMAINNAISGARILISTYKKLSTAFSEPRFTTAIFWSTVKELTEQSVGRIGRYTDIMPEWNERMRHVYDIIDDGQTLSKVQYIKHREKVYQRLGFEIQKTRWRREATEQ